MRNPHLFSFPSSRLGTSVFEAPLRHSSGDHAARGFIAFRRNRITSRLPDPEVELWRSAFPGWSLRRFSFPSSRLGTHLVEALLRNRQRPNQNYSIDGSVQEDFASHQADNFAIRPTRTAWPDSVRELPPRNARVIFCPQTIPPTLF